MRGRSVRVAVERLQPKPTGLDDLRLCPSLSGKLFPEWLDKVLLDIFRTFWVQPGQDKEMLDRLGMAIGIFQKEVRQGRMRLHVIRVFLQDNPEMLFCWTAPAGFRKQFSKLEIDCRVSGVCLQTG